MASKYNQPDMTVKGSAKPDSEATLAETINVGLTVDSRYLIEREIGRGGMGAVYLARDIRLHNKRVVIKVMSHRFNEDPWITSKFRQEAEVLSRISHPGIVSVLDVGEMPDGKPYVVMNFVDGASLRTLITPEGMPFTRVANLTRQIALALEAANNKGIVHRDLKPENIVVRHVGGDEQAMIIDFGVARMQDADAKLDTQIRGTMAYMAPEQLEGGRLSVATDIYSLAIIVYEMLTGRRPFDVHSGPNPYSSLYQLFESQRLGVQIKPNALRPDLPEEAQEVILRALSFQPETRYQSAKAFAADFVAALPIQTNEGDLPLEKASIGNSARRLFIERRLVWTTLAMAFLLLATLVFFKLTVPSSAPVSVLSYWILVHRSREAPNDPFRVPFGVLFENGDRLTLSFTNQKSGHLYVMVEAFKGQQQGGGSYDPLFPSPSINNGSSMLNANELVQLPQLIVLSESPGTDYVWIVWSAQPVRELEEIKALWISAPGHRPLDQPQMQFVREFLERHSATKPVVEVNVDKQETTLKSNSKIVVSRLELSHR